MRTVAGLSAILHLIGAVPAVVVLWLLSKPGGTGLFGVTNGPWSDDELTLWVCGLIVIVLAVLQLAFAVHKVQAVYFPVLLLLAVDIVIGIRTGFMPVSAAVALQVWAAVMIRGDLGPRSTYTFGADLLAESPEPAEPPAH